MKASHSLPVAKVNAAFSKPAAGRGGPLLKFRCIFLFWSKQISTAVELAHVTDQTSTQVCVYAWLQLNNRQALSEGILPVDWPV
jgi:hypothetical protein